MNISLYFDGVTYTAAGTRPLTMLNVNDLPTGGLRIEGEGRSAGSVLTAVSSIEDEDGMGAPSYQWRADGQAVAGATGATLTLGQGEAGKAITVVASYVDGFGQAESVSGDAASAPRHVNTVGSSRVFTLGAAPPAAMRVLTTYADRYGVVEAQAHAIGSEGKDVLRGDGAAETIMAKGGNDTIIGSGRGDRIDGGDGLDTFVTSHMRYLFSQTPGVPGQWQVSDIIFSGDPIVLTNVERVHFGDARDGVALDYDGHAGQAYRLYQAAFERSPDKAGLGFWMSRPDSGVDLLAVADAFVASGEFKDLYGVDPGNAEIVTRFYQHVLHRAPDPGSQYWIDLLERKVATVAQVLLGFSESAENVAALVGVKDTGIDFTPYTGA